MAMPTIVKNVFVEGRSCDDYRLCLEAMPNRWTAMCQIKNRHSTICLNPTGYDIFFTYTPPFAAKGRRTLPVSSRDSFLLEFIARWAIATVAPCRSNVNWMITTARTTTISYRIGIYQTRISDGEFRTMYLALRNLHKASVIHLLLVMTQSLPTHVVARHFLNLLPNR